jgi:hypothetical protein
VRRQGKPISVQIETSDYGRSRGVPFVISAIGERGYRVVGSSEKLPPYSKLKESVAELIRQELA